MIKNKKNHVLNILAIQQRCQTLWYPQPNIDNQKQQINLKTEMKSDIETDVLCLCEWNKVGELNNWVSVLLFVLHMSSNKEKQVTHNPQKWMYIHQAVEMYTFSLFVILFSFCFRFPQWRTAPISTKNTIGIIIS